MYSSSNCNYSNNRYLHLYTVYPGNQPVFGNRMKTQELSYNSELGYANFQKPFTNFNQFEQHNTSTTKEIHFKDNDYDLINPLDILDNASFIKFIDLNFTESVVVLSKIKYVKLIDKEGNIILKELHKKDFQKSLLKISENSLDILDKDIILFNFIDYNNKVKSFRIDQFRFIRLYDKKINVLLTKSF